MLHRRFFSAASQNQIVMDGLIFRLNGKHMGNIPGAWVDEVGGIVFRKNENFSNSPIRMNDGFKFQHPSGMKGTASSPFWYQGTFEMCIDSLYYQSENARVFMQGVDTSRKMWGVGRWNSSNQWNTTSKALPEQDNVKGFKCNGMRGTFSFMDTLGVQNKQTMVRGKNDRWTAAGARNDIFLGYSGSEDPEAFIEPDFFDGIIHEIRIYNRVLSREEIMQNQTHDLNTYFGGVVPL